MRKTDNVKLKKDCECQQKLQRKLQGAWRRIAMCRTGRGRVRPEYTQHLHYPWEKNFHSSITQ